MPSTDPITVARTTALTDLFAVLADRSRLELLFLLADGGEHASGALASSTGLGRSTVSHHLLLLRLHGLVEARTAHRNVYYRLAERAAAAGDGAAALAIRTRVGACVRVVPAPPPVAETSPPVAVSDALPGP